MNRYLEILLLPVTILWLLIGGFFYTSALIVEDCYAQKRYVRKQQSDLATEALLLTSIGEDNIECF